MLDSNLPWQIDVLIIETLASLVVGMLMLHYRVTRVSMTNAALLLCWSLACVLLILTGGSLTWQHFVILSAETYAVAKGIIRIRNGGWVGTEKTRRSIATTGLTAGGSFFAFLFGVGVIWLLVAGVA